MTRSGVFATMSIMDTSLTMTPPTEQDQTAVDRYVALAVRGLVPMFDQDRQLFCYSLKKNSQGLPQEGMAQEGISPRYTMMTLMGLHRLEEAGGVSPIEIDIDRVLQSMLANLDWVQDIGDVGVLLWTCALIAPDRLADVAKRIDLDTALLRYRSAKRGVTMELAWFLTGLSNWALACPDQQPRLRDLACQT